LNTCFLAVGVTEAREAFLKLTPDRQAVYHKHSKEEISGEEATHKWSVRMMLNNPDLYVIYKKTPQ
jgi:hypothetical protein